MPIKNWTDERRAHRKEYSHDWYVAHAEEVKDRRSARLQVLHDWLQNYKSNLRCSRCGEDRIATLDFHHRDSSQKEYSVTKAIQRGWKVERVLNEIAKCDVLCANCHRKLHARQE